MARRSKERVARGGVSRRGLETREPTLKILIVCEGVKTEPEYFKKFPVPKDVAEVHGLGMDPLRLVQQARKLAHEYRQRTGYSYGQVWCVFARDEFPLERFRQALQLAAESKFEVAYSNPAFEIWYLLHFGFSDRPMTRRACCSSLSAHLGCPYEKNQSWYSQLLSAQEQAIEHAAKLLARYDSPDPARNNPSTTVHLLVQELRRLKRK